jgi:hypothetical protein
VCGALIDLLRSRAATRTGLHVTVPPVELVVGSACRISVKKQDYGVGRQAWKVGVAEPVGEHSVSKISLPKEIDDCEQNSFKKLERSRELAGTRHGCSLVDGSDAKEGGAADEGESC